MRTNTNSYNEVTYQSLWSSAGLRGWVAKLLSEGFRWGIWSDHYRAWQQGFVIMLEVLVLMQNVGWSNSTWGMTSVLEDPAPLSSKWRQQLPLKCWYLLNSSCCHTSEDCFFFLWIYSVTAVPTCLIDHDINYKTPCYKCNKFNYIQLMNYTSPGRRHKQWWMLQMHQYPSFSGMPQ